MFNFVLWYPKIALKEEFACRIDDLSKVCLNFEINQSNLWTALTMKVLQVKVYLTLFLFYFSILVNNLTDLPVFQCNEYKFNEHLLFISQFIKVCFGEHDSMCFGQFIMSFVCFILPLYFIVTRLHSLLNLVSVYGHDVHGIRWRNNWLQAWRFLNNWWRKEFGHLVEKLSICSEWIGGYFLRWTKSKSVHSDNRLCAPKNSSFNFLTICEIVPCL